MSPLEIRVLPISELKPAPYNPRRVLSPTSPAYRKLKASLSEFGLVEPLVWNELSGYVVGGHARLRILKELGVTEVSVSVVWLTDAREKALNVLLNNQEAQGRYDSSKLADLLTELEETAELELTGFDARTLTNLRFEPAEAEAEPEANPDRVEITLVTDAATYEKFATELDVLVGRYDLVTHLRRGGG
ncbi:MAG: ParB N-terminal domain-containing protein [Planctomycetes bacterium]|nr:ParB N-terminal domain-containing protein [Planctomycetota bacterium]